MQLLRSAAMLATAASLAVACGSAATTPPTPPKTTTVPIAATATANQIVASATPAPLPVGTMATPPVAAGSGGSGDLCSLLTLADLATATGKTYLAGTLDAAGQCNWNTDASGVNSGDLILLAVQALPLDYVTTSYATGGVAVTVAGHPGFWNPSTGLQSLWVDIGGGNLLVLSFPRSTDLTAADQTAAQALAEIAIGNM